jgi:hypothetical protein
MLSQNGPVQHVAFTGSNFLPVRAMNFLTSVVYIVFTNWTHFHLYRQMSTKLIIKNLKQNLCCVSGNLGVKWTEIHVNKYTYSYFPNKWLSHNRTNFIHYADETQYLRSLSFCQHKSKFSFNYLFFIFCIYCNSIRWVRSNWATASWNDMGFILNCCLTTNSRDRWRVTSLKFERDEA